MRYIKVGTSSGLRFHYNKGLMSRFDGSILKFFVHELSIDLPPLGNVKSVKIWRGNPAVELFYKDSTLVTVQF